MFERLFDRIVGLLGLDFELDLAGDGPTVSRITPTLFVGARPEPDDVPTLLRLGITRVVSCLTESHRAEMAFLQGDFDTLFIPLHDGMREDLGGALAAWSAFADAAPRDKLLVHCRVGVSRSASLAVARVMQTERRRFFDAYTRVRGGRPGVLPNIGFATQLQRLEDTLDLPPSPGPSSLAQYLHSVCKVPAALPVIDDMLQHNDHDAIAAIRAIFGGEIPRVVQGVRL